MMAWTGTFADLMEGRETDPDHFESPTAEYPWGRVYGGQAVAQALWAAGQTVKPEYLPHSLHAYFIRGGKCDRPLHFEVQRIRDGRSFMTRHVLGRQDGKVMLELTASFHTPEQWEPSASAISTEEPAPTQGEPCDWSSLMERNPLPPELGRARTWVRFLEDVEATPLMQACAMAFLSDDVPTEAVLELHPTVRELRQQHGRNSEAIWERLMNASLDHAIWFHEIAPPTEWQLHDFTSEVVGNGRGMSQGRIFGADGRLLASVMQEVVIRSTERPNSA